MPVLSGQAAARGDGCLLLRTPSLLLRATPREGTVREAGLAYAALCPIVNHAAGLGDSTHVINRAELKATREAAMEQVMRILTRFAGSGSGSAS